MGLMSRSMATCTLVFAFACTAAAAIIVGSVSALITGETAAAAYYGGKNPPTTTEDDQSFSPMIDLQRAYHSPSPFVFKKPDRAFCTDSGEFKVVVLGEEDLMQRRKFAVGLLTMEPESFLLPHYLNGPSVFYVHRGTAHLSHVHDCTRKSMVLAAGELYTISAGTLFYVFNAQSNEKLEIITLVDLSDMPKHITLECFYVAGGTYPTTVIAGFMDEVIATAFKVTPEEIRDLFSSQDQGPIINTTKMQRRKLTSFMNDHQSLDEYTPFLNKKERHYHLLNNKHVFRNQNGWSVAIDRRRYKHLEEADVGMFAVGLKSGCMVAPHWNPTATKIGIVTHGRGSLQIVHSNGTNAVNKEVELGSIFVIPRYHPSSQIAGDDSDFEFVGFTTSSQPVRPQFLAGTNSVFQSISSNVLSKAFNIAKDYILDVLGAQPDAIILTTEKSNWGEAAAAKSI